MLNPFHFLKVFLSLLASAGYILVILFIVFILLTLALWQTESLPFLDALYLSSVTALTIGYGDLFPRTIR